MVKLELLAGLLVLITILAAPRRERVKTVRPLGSRGSEGAHEDSD